MITADQLKQFLNQYGASLPDFLINLIIEQVNEIEACLIGAGYSDATQTMIALYAATILAGNTGTRRVKSQAAPSGASQSFEYGALDFTQLRRTLRSLDTSGCTTDLIGPDPKSGSFFRVVTGC